MKTIIACVTIIALFAFAMGVLVGTAMVEDDRDQCQIVSPNLSDVLDLSRGREAIRLESGEWCLKK